MAEGEGAGLEGTPTYSVALTAFTFILVSLLVERSIHWLKKYLKRNGQKPLRKVLDKMTEELMLLGFISLLLTVLQNRLVKICVTRNFSQHMLPCNREDYVEVEGPSASEVSHVSIVGRKLLDYYFSTAQVGVGPKRRFLAEEASSTTGHCGSQGKVPFVTLEVLHELHIFVFVLAITHVFYCAVTVGLGFARLHNWQKWELETRQDGYDGNIELERKYCQKMQCKKKKLVGVSGHANAFVDRHANHQCYDHTITLWILCFFQQFFASVSREDYLIFRVGFLNKHSLGESFNFRDYVIRSMEVDFKKVIGISWWLWLFVVLFLLINIHGWHTYFWAAFIPTFIVLVVGAKQQHIISTLALQAKKHAAQVLAAEAEGNQSRKISRAPKVIDIGTAVNPNDNLFWFNSPKLLLRLIHFVIFQNSFELAVFFWLVTGNGWNSCILGNHILLIVRLIAGILTQLLVSYSTLPIYALVTQMGSQLKGTLVFRKHTTATLQGWTQRAKKRAEERKTTSSEENSVKSVDSESGRDGTYEESEQFPSNVELPTIHSARALQRCDADPELKRKCQLLYGKTHGLDKINAAKVNPS